MQEGFSGQLDVTYYTDPLDVWSWAFEPVWRRLRAEFGAQISWRYKMTGMIADWQRFDDPLNAVSRPAQMGPYWLQVRHMTAMPLDELLWVEDAPASSYPACLAVKAAELQGAAAAEAYLRRARRAGLLERRNVARGETLIALAREMAEAGDVAEWDAARFCEDLEGEAAREAFRDDLKDVSYRGIGRSPTLILRRGDGKASMVVGYRPYPLLLEAARYLSPQLQPVARVDSAVAYAEEWGETLAAEAAIATGRSEAEATAELEAAVASGQLRKVAFRVGALYVATPQFRREPRGSVG